MACLRPAQRKVGKRVETETENALKYTLARILARHTHAVQLKARLFSSKRGSDDAKGMTHRATFTLLSLYAWQVNEPNKPVLTATAIVITHINSAVACNCKRKLVTTMTRIHVNTA